MNAPPQACGAKSHQERNLHSATAFLAFLGGLEQFLFLGRFFLGRALVLGGLGSRGHCCCWLLSHWCCRLGNNLHKRKCGKHLRNCRCCRCLTSELGHLLGRQGTARGQLRKDLRRACVDGRTSDHGDRRDGAAHEAAGEGDNLGGHIGHRGHGRHCLRGGPVRHVPSTRCRGGVGHRGHGGHVGRRRLRRHNGRRHSSAGDDRRGGHRWGAAKSDRTSTACFELLRA
mmetsp:Transcript_47712/g.120940  ORF Transcript_47712/g.120940 Transcript_47712/m.120940 type:complete len:228 (-) Transcript_47712:7-690(-)